MQRADTIIPVGHNGVKSRGVAPPTAVGSPLSEGTRRMAGAVTKKATAPPFSMSLHSVKGRVVFSCENLHPKPLTSFRFCDHLCKILATIGNRFLLPILLSDDQLVVLYTQ